MHKQLQPNSSAEFNRRLYAGPKIQGEMKEIAKGLDLSVDYGMFSIHFQTFILVVAMVPQSWWVIGA